MYRLKNSIKPLTIRLLSKFDISSATLFSSLVQEKENLCSWHEYNQKVAKIQILMSSRLVLLKFFPFCFEAQDGSQVVQKFFAILSQSVLTQLDLMKRCCHFDVTSRLYFCAEPLFCVCGYYVNNKRRHTQTRNSSICQGFSK